MKVDDEEVKCHKCGRGINPYDDPVYVINLETRQALVCLNCIPMYKAEIETGCACCESTCGCACHLGG